MLAKWLYIYIFIFFVDFVDVWCMAGNDWPGLMASLCVRRRRVYESINSRPFLDKKKYLHVQQCIFCVGEIYWICLSLYIYPPLIYLLIDNRSFLPDRVVRAVSEWRERRGHCRCRSIVHHLEHYLSSQWISYLSMCVCVYSMFLWPH